MSLGGCVIAITGKLKVGSRAEIEKLVTEKGGEFASSVKKGVTHLVTNDPTGTSAKLEKARKLGVLTVGEEFLTGGGDASVEKKRKTTDDDDASTEGNNSKPAKKAKADEPVSTDTVDNALEGKVIAISGKLTKPRTAIKSIILSHKGLFAESITAKVTHLITDDPDSTSAKVLKAKKAGVCIVAESFLDNLNAATSVKEAVAEKISEDDAAEKSPKVKTIESIESLEGKVIAITGKLKLPRASIKKIIIDNKGAFAESITSKVTHLVVEDPSSTSAKIVKAKKSGVEIVGESFLDKFI